MTKEQAITQIRSIEKRCRGLLPDEIRQQVNQLLAEGKAEEARDLDAQSRSGCGADFNEIVINGPWDGKVHAYKCPVCGVKGEYRAPCFPDLEQ